MACYKPLTAYKTPAGSVEFTESVGATLLRLPCGHCIGCRLERAQGWAVRCQHEASLYDYNAFVTLTYDDEHMPKFGSLRYRDVQLMLKRLRKACRGVEPSVSGKYPIRFFAAGEYGEHTDRPHYHLLLFNYDFPDKYKVGGTLCGSEILNRLWPFGQSAIGAVSSASAAYVARYSLKKVYGAVESGYRYECVDIVTGEVGRRACEFAVMSRRPGIGAEWYERYGRDVLPNDYVVVDNRKLRVPRFYSDRYEAEDPEGMAVVREARELTAIELGDSSWDRLQVKEAVARARVEFFSKRGG